MKTLSVAVLGAVLLSLLIASLIENVAMGAPPSPVPGKPLPGFGDGLVVVDPTPLPPPPVDPSTQPPQAPADVRVTGRTENSVSLTWRDRSEYEDGYELYRIGPANSWELIATMGPLSDWQSYEDTGLTSDALYCYRLRVFNEHGEKLSPQGCAYTKDGRNLKVWRAQLTVRTADVEDAGTDGGINVLLNSKVSMYYPYGNSTWLDYGRDDFERGDEFTYDLLLDNISELSDVTLLSISKTGDDGWCIEEITLKINGVDIYNEHFGSTSSTCLWLENEAPHSTIYSVFHEKLRAHPLWQGFTQPTPPLGIPAGELQSRIESMVGDSIHGTELYWGFEFDGQYVHISRKNDTTVHVAIELKAEAPGPNPDVDIDFDLVFTVTCADDSITIDISSQNVNIVADSDWFWEALSLGLIEFVDNEVESRVENSFDGLAETIVINDVPDIIACITISVDGFGNVVFMPVFASQGGDTNPTNPGVHPVGPVIGAEIVETPPAPPGDSTVPTNPGVRPVSPVIDAKVIEASPASPDGNGAPSLSPLAPSKGAPAQQNSEAEEKMPMPTTRNLMRR